VYLLRSALDGLSLHHSDFTFVDFGSGMGRVVLYAARLPFKQVIGVEFAEELHAAAEQNVRNTEGAPERLSPIRLYCMDATEFELPEGNLVCFFSNPFGEPVMERVIGRLTRSLVDQQRECMLIYLFPIHRAVIETDRHWEVLEERQSCVIYRFIRAKLAGDV
jgi:predicted RNA methylase